LFGESFTHRDHFHSGVDMARCQGTPVYVVEDDLEVIGVGGSSLTVGSYRYVHIQEIVVREDQDVNEGDQLAEIGPYGAAGCGGDHLHFVEAGEEYSEDHPEFDWGVHLENFEVAKEDPLRRMRGEDAGLDPAPTDNTDPVIEEAGLIHNAGDTTANWQPFPRLDADDPEAGPELEAVDAAHNDTWVVWGSVEAWADAFDPRVNGSEDRALGVHQLTSDFSYDVDGRIRLMRDQGAGLEMVSDSPLHEFFGDSFAYSTFDTIPGVQNRQLLAEHAFRQGSRISPTDYYYLLHNNIYGDINDVNNPVTGLNRFWDTNKILITAEELETTGIYRKFPDGPYQWAIEVRDVEGNEADSIVEKIAVDNMKPVLLKVNFFQAGRAPYFPKWGENNAASGLIIDPQHHELEPGFTFSEHRNYVDGIL
jgi:murein DD-endopeptidase MepM/ murein hydrolase activator NlpD